MENTTIMSLNSRTKCSWNTKIGGYIKPNSKSMPCSGQNKRHETSSAGDNMRSGGYFHVLVEPGDHGPRYQFTEVPPSNRFASWSRRTRPRPMQVVVRRSHI